MRVQIEGASRGGGACGAWTYAVRAGGAERAPAARGQPSEPPASVRPEVSSISIRNVN